ncbi:pyridoxamine 5'-phosphate oxidase [Catenovulum sp. SM1970]|uniref:pyridoxamine 5'-phosphate oxidase n=1 Tax=Marinifaba aquimaris TaxID=2741323 RepID=UPI001574CF3C|nr:pyridoxamine 5'-phosphate oxidase [Marinifaba aquimaris]NTS77574.1 pyridoxamine 5'-phosphate oxidase [Marinifaba aquimaris]
MDLKDIRREYSKMGLDESQLDQNPIKQFDLWLTQASETDLFTDPTAMTVATVDKNGMPSMRTVLLKGYDEKGFVFYTNYGSRKAQEIAGNNQVCLQFAWLPLERQVIIYGNAKKLSATESASYFNSRPEGSQIAAYASKQSMAVESRKMLEHAFEQMKNKFKQGKLPVPDFWGGYCIEPVAIEFWQGRESRLHDRFMYKLQDDGQWQVERLQP